MIKARIFQVLEKLYKNSWKTEKKIKILIQTNKYFTEHKWKDKLKNNLKLFNQAEIIFTNNKFKIRCILKNAQFAFLWSLSRFYIIYNSSLSMIYLGTVGNESLDLLQIPSDIIIKNPKNISSKAIAEYCVALTLLVNRNLIYPIKNQLSNKWNQDVIIKTGFTSILDKTIGIMGLGNVGGETARYFKRLGCKVIGYDIKENILSYVDEFYDKNNIREFLRQSDYLIITLPLNGETKNLINEETLQYIKDNAVIINVARGQIINDIDLIKALKNQKIKAAVLDVFCKEPLNYFNKLWRMPNTIITPHIAGNVNLFVEEIQLDFVNTINDILE